VVFQESRLMPWLRVRDNITFGLKKDEIREEKVATLLRLTGLTSFARTKPAQLSGGMRQRTAIARALAVEPDFLLMDEPFAALDYFTRESMQRSLLAIQKKTGCGILFITHSIDEALILADQILIMGNGRIYKRYQLTAGSSSGKAAGRDLSELKEDILMNI
jgi:sulfonate transport system ATP-binding protein